ncbi:extracellular fatty acid-binding protein-like [Heteronotia binoei]|uniref:extracellular fatty acid-binding protein-like n=1 Tax=Heteronotia binoei TaxID=13085 RepID=UPI00292CF82E|nr:extracellular fatty acid-binding protein-like [Heteronotia binoei]
MNVWLVGLGLALLCTVSAESECSEDLNQWTGKWYVTAVASNCEHMLKHKDKIKILTNNVSVNEDGKLQINANFPNHHRKGGHGCKKIEIVFEKLADGTYSHTSDRNFTKKMEVVSTDCKTYIIAHVQIKRNEKTSESLMMQTKEPEPSPEHQEKFSKIAENEGYTKEKIIFPKGMACENEAEEMPAA